MKKRTKSKKPKARLRLYVWEGFAPDYTGGLAFAIAVSEEAARKAVIKSQGYEPSDWGALSVHPLTKRVAFSASGGG